MVDKGIAVSAGACYDGTALDTTRLGVYGTPKPGTSLPQLEEAIDAVLAEVVDNGVTAEELERAKSRMIADAVYAKDNQRTLARWYRRGAGDRRDRRGGARLARPHPAPSPPTPCTTPPAAGSTSAARSPAIWSRTRRHEEKRS